MKEEARSHGGSHLMVTNDQRTISAMSEAHKEHKKRMDEENRLKKQKYQKRKAEEEKQRLEEERKQEAKSKSKILDKKSEKLQKDRKETDTEIQVVKNLLTNAKQKMTAAISTEDLIKIRAAQTLHDQATAKLESLLAKQKTQLDVVSTKIGEKRKKTMEDFFGPKKKKTTQ